MDEGNLNYVGSLDKAELVFVCDTPTSRVFNDGKVLTKPAMEVMARHVRDNGMDSSKMLFVTCAPPLPETATTDGRVKNFVLEYRQELVDFLKLVTNKRLVIPMGKTPCISLEGKAVAVTKITGRCRRVEGVSCQVYPLLSPGNVLRRPEVKAQFASEFRGILELAEFDYNAKAMADTKTADKYEWVTDIQHLLDKPPVFAGFDIEYDKRCGVLVCQISYQDWDAIVVPMKQAYVDQHKEEFASLGITKIDEERIWGQMREFLRIVPQAGHNFKGDCHELKREGCTEVNWAHDTMQLAFAEDENMINKSLSECVKRWVPEQAGYSDEFDSTVDKSKMMDVPPSKMLPYGGGDAEVTYMLAKRLAKSVQSDARQWECYKEIQMPSLKMFKALEETGLLVDRRELMKLQDRLAEAEAELYKDMIAKVDPRIKAKHVEAGLKFTRDAFVRDILFTPASEGGLGLTPIVFTKGTQRLPLDERVPSISSKEHLPYFDSLPFVAQLIEYSKLQKMKSTYVGFDTAWALKRVKRLKKGGLPKALKAKCDLLGLGLVGDRLHRNGRMLRTRTRVASFERQRVMIRHSASLDADTRIAVDTGGNVWLENRTDASGFWQYLQDGNKLFPSYHLHRVVTGRTSSSNPNAQNFPKRGKLAKAFRKVFIAPEGYTIIGVDLSQAELRIAAWMANETNMLRIYREGGDIHSTTAAAVMGISLKEFVSWKDSEEPVPQKYRTAGFDGTTLGDLFEFRRFQAKAVNFGFLYGMGWRKFMAYAKTDYNLDLTEGEAKAMRNTFFQLYPRLEHWHKSMREFVREHGYVRALHGAIRRLPSIWSDDDKVAAEAERQAINSPVQRFASDLGLMGLVDYFAEGYPKDLIMPQAFIHDAGYILARDDKAEEMAAGLKWCMENQQIEEIFGIKSPIPICADVEMGKTLADLHGVKMDAVMPNWLSA